MRNTFYYSGLVLLLILGAGTDYVRETILRNYTSLTGNITPSIVFNGVTSLVFMALVFALAQAALRKIMSVAFASFVLAVGLIFLIFPLLISQGIIVPRQVLTLGQFRLHTSMAGAFWFISGLSQLANSRRANC